MTQFAQFCFTTSEGRNGYFVVDSTELESNGKLSYLGITFTVWKGPDDL